MATNEAWFLAYRVGYPANVSDVKKHFPPDDDNGIGLYRRNVALYGSSLAESPAQYRAL